MNIDMALTLDTIPEVAAAKTRWVPLQHIAAEDDMQPRLTISEDAIRRYKDTLRANPRAFPPILLADIGTTKETWRGEERALVVVDGWHRFRAHGELGKDRIQARVIQCSTEHARWIAALANMHHGLPLKRGDQRRVFRRYVEAGQNRHPDGSPKSYRAIVEDLSGLRAANTIHGWMQQDFPKIAAEMAKRGEVMEETAPREHRLSYTQQRMKEFSLALVRMAKMAVKEDREDAREYVLWCSMHLTENIGWTLGIDPRELFEVAKEAAWQQQQAAEAMADEDL